METRKLLPEIILENGFSYYRNLKGKKYALYQKRKGVKLIDHIVISIFAPKAGWVFCDNCRSVGLILRNAESYFYQLEAEG